MPKKRKKQRRECRHLHTERIKGHRKNYNFGRRSTPIYSIKYTSKLLCLDCGRILKE